MDPKELKQLLKEAKEGLKKNDYIGAAKACKTIIKKEPENYQANLLLGTSFREQGKFQQALEAYKRAVQIDGSQVYAWQGVISVYEKQNIKAHPDLLDAYKRVATHFEKDDKQKYIENTLKLANILISQQDCAKALKVIGRLAKSAGLSLEIAQLLVLLLNNTTSETRSADEDDLYTRALEVLVTQTPQPAEETYRKYFSQLFRSSQFAKLAQRCIAIQDQWNYYYSPMEWICRLYLESKIDQQLLIQAGGIQRITDKLFKLHPSSRYGYFARGKYLIEESLRYVEGFNWINNALESSYNLHAALVLTRGKLKFGDFEGALDEAAKGIVNCKDDKVSDRTELVILFELLFLEGLLGINDSERAEQQRLKLEEMFSQNSEHAYMSLFLDLSLRTKIKKQHLSELSPLVSALESSSKTSAFALPVWKLDFYKAVKEGYESQKDYSSRIKTCIEIHNQDRELMLESAIFLFDYENYEYAAEILTSLIGTKEGTGHPHTWKYLGKLAFIEGNLQKAAKFFKKSYELNLDSEVGATLADIYHEIGELESKKNLLIDASRKVRKTNSKWVWSRLGLLYLEEGDLLQAVECLQSAIRVDLEDGFLWESLADAYFYRGSLQAALRCYNKAMEHGVDPIYPKMRISAIFQYLEEEDKSVAGLKELLQENPHNTPLQLELARLYCWVASEKMKENFDRGAITAVENGLICVVKAVMYSTQTMLLPWLIIGDYSILLNGLLESSQLHVPYLLVQAPGQDINLNEMLNPTVISLQQFKEIGTKALLKCLGIMNTSPDVDDKIKHSSELMGYVYHQIALSLFNRSFTNQNDEGKQFLLTGLQYCKKAISKSEHNSMYWNTIGLISMRLSDFTFSQHCFIRSLQADSNNVVAWGNLGMLYYNQGDPLLAHRAFSKGQSVAPVYAGSWIGQALCAEVIEPSEAVDLFRHACQLRPHPFAVLSYGNAVCDLILNPEEFQRNMSPEDYRYYSQHLLVRMDAVTHLHDLITRIECRTPSAQLFNLKGLVAGWNGFYQTALESFTTSIEISSTDANTLSDDEVLNVRSNKVSSLVALNKFVEAKEELVKFPSLDFVGFCNAAITLYKMNEVEGAIEMYKRILEIPGLEKKKPDVKIALALLANLTRGMDAAKTILFGKDMMKSPRALITLGAIAVSQDDLHLLRAVIHELGAFQWTDDLVLDIAFIKVCYEILRKSFKSAVRVILQLIHMHPTNSKLYALACQVMITYNLENFDVSIPRHLALCTLKMARIMGTSREESLFASKHSGVVSLTHLYEYNVNVAVMSTLKALRCYPEQRDNWAVLSCAYWMQYSKSRNPKLVLNVINILDREIELKLCSPRVAEWMVTFRLEIAKYCS